MAKIEDLESNKYWMQNDDKRYQRFYIAFCLLNSAIFDYSVGLDLKTQKKLNWSASCFYYSMVHCARLLLFIPFGNYPCSHSGMISYLENNANHVTFNWLDDFLNNTKELRIFNKKVYNKNYLVELYKEKYLISNFESRFNKFTSALGNSKRLREDSNYEALLIAHENFHPLLETFFNDLTDVISNKSKFVLDFAIEIIKKHIEVDFNDAYSFEIKSFINHELSNNVKNRIFTRINSEECKLEINRLLENIMFHEDLKSRNEPKWVTKLEKSFSMSIFSEKSALFRNFRDKINNLRDS